VLRARSEGRKNASFFNMPRAGAGEEPQRRVAMFVKQYNIGDTGLRILCYVGAKSGSHAASQLPRYREARGSVFGLPGRGAGSPVQRETPGSTAGGWIRCPRTGGPGNSRGCALGRTDWRLWPGELTRIEP
jgi:hypothetical protein